VSFFAGEVDAIDLKRKQVKVSHGFDRHHHDLSYDHLVIGVGSITNFFNLPGLEERALTMKSLGDAIHLRNRVIALLEEASTECCADIRGPLLTFVVAGGGFAGVETVAALNDFARQAIRYYSNLREDMLRVVLVLHPRQSKRADTRCTRRFATGLHALHAVHERVLERDRTLRPGLMPISAPLPVPKAIS
jgi:NADH:ubiquinone reductase (H+-translocating)